MCCIPPERATGDTSINCEGHCEKNLDQLLITELEDRAEGFTREPWGQGWQSYGVVYRGHGDGYSHQALEIQL